MAVNMVTLPEPESGTKRPKLTTPKYGAFAMVLSAEQYKLCTNLKCAYLRQMHIFAQIRYFTLLFITDTRWNPSNYANQLRHIGIENILSTL